MVCMCECVFKNIYNIIERRNVLCKKKRFLSAKEVGEIMGRSTSYAHRYICQLNEELEKKGYLTIKGRVVSTYFYERFFGKDDETKDSKYIRIQR